MTAALGLKFVNRSGVNAARLVTALGKDLRAAQTSAYAAVEAIRFDAAHFRRDIAAKGVLSNGERLQLSVGGCSNFT